MNNKFVYYVVECVEYLSGIWEEIDCDGTSRQKMKFRKGQKYRTRFIPNEAVVYPDNEWDGTYRYEYIKLDDFNKHFKIVRELKPDEELNIDNE